MRIEKLDPDLLKRSLRSGCDNLELNSALLDDLNVYPVPDGDTGTNMLATLRPAVQRLENCSCSTLEEMCDCVSSTTMSNSRGNSGFILAQFFRGFCEEVAGLSSITPGNLLVGFEAGSFSAVRALLSPVDGTMITVIASMTECLKSLGPGDISLCFETMVESGIGSVHATPEQLPVLARAGVVDAGALGFLLIVKGMRNGMAGLPAERESEEDYRFEPSEPDFESSSVAAGLEFRFCLELEVELGQDCTSALRDFLRDSGSSIALIADGSRIKIHIHTNIPDRIIDWMGNRGEILRQKLDDMDEQVSRSKPAAPAGSGTARNGPAVLSVVPGPGFEPIFTGLGADVCLVCMDNLPSVEDLRSRVELMENTEVIVLPNNQNNIPTAKLLGEQTEKRVYVVKTRNPVEGITAMYGYSESDSTEENVANMSDCIGLAETVRIYRSSRNTSYAGVTVRQGQFFAMKDDRIVSADDSLHAVVVAALDKIDLRDRSAISLYYGVAIDDEAREKIRQSLAKLCSALEYEEHYGGQQRSALLVAVE